MRYKKSLKRSLVAVALTISVLVANLFPNIAYADASDSSDSLLRMQQLGILDSNIVDSSAYVTRGQFARAIVEVNSWKDIALAMMGSTVYPDIDSNSESSGYVNLLKDKGLMYGMSDGYFHEELPITYAEACTTLVKLLGYADSDVTGTWPNNYISKASDLKITKGLGLRKNSKVTVEIISVMFNRLLDTNMKKSNASEADKTFAQYKNLYTDIIVYDNSLTYSGLESNALLTDKGTLFISDSSMSLKAGSSYRVRLDGTNVEKVYGEISSTFSVVVDNLVDNTIYYKDRDINKDMVLPYNVTYYYHGTKQNYSSLSSLIKTDTAIVFAYNENNTAYEYAIVIDPVYSKLEIATSFDPKTDKLGNIAFDADTKIIKDGKSIFKSDIEEMDVVYSITDVNGNNRYIMVYSNKVEGKIKGFSSNGPLLTNIQIDNTNYSISKDADLANISKFKVDDKVAAIMGSDGKVIALRKIEYKSGTEYEIKILGNIKTDASLSEKEVLTDKGKYYILDSTDKLEVGGKYIVNIDEDTIVKIKKSENIVESIGVTNLQNSTISYVVGAKKKTIELPEISEYYYKGQKIDYITALAKLQVSSSIILSKNATNYEYGIIYDPIFSKPIIKTPENWSDIKKMFSDDDIFAYKNGAYITSEYLSQIGGFIDAGDVVYSVSDIWGSNKYIFIVDTRITGVTVQSVLPNKINPVSIKVNNVSYSFSKYFDISKLRAIGKDYIVDITLDMDGKVIDIKASTETDN